MEGKEWSTGVGPDFPDQINNVLAFPGCSAGSWTRPLVADTSTVLLAAARALAAVVNDAELNAPYIVPSVFHPDAHQAVAAAVRRSAGIAEPALGDV